MHQVINKNDVNEGVLLQQHKNLEGLFYLLQYQSLCTKLVKKKRVKGAYVL